MEVNSPDFCIYYWVCTCTVCTETVLVYNSFLSDQLFSSLQHVNRTLSSVGGTVAAACAAWDEYLYRHKYLQKMSIQENTPTQMHFLNEQNRHLCWAGKKTNYQAMGRLECY